VPQDRDDAGQPAARATDGAAAGQVPDQGARTAGRAADHEAIDRLAGALVPALIAKLGSLNVGELEIREGDWRIRLRRPAGATGPLYGRRSTDRPSRAHPGHEQHGHAPATPEPRRGQRSSSAPADPSTNGRGGPGLDPGSGERGAGSGTTASAGMAGGATRGARDAGAPDDPGLGQIATSPAVGVFQPGPNAVGGTRVRAGDRLGVVDMLGVPQEVVAPADGIVVGVIVDAGTAVEYGQELIHLEPAAAVEGR
jgi:biotin carboxyl carrier protein